ncbi:MAG: NAD(+) synthase, partial [Bacilli bacterium]|nr:NAD(+) synthase [Bacilli bacterium]
KIADVESNKREIIRLIEEAKIKKVNVLVFQELTLTSYTAQDLFFHNELEEKTLKAIDEIKEHVDDSILVFIGGPFSVLSKRFNVAFALFNKKVVGIVPKSYLPNYNEFYEKRWFKSAFETEEKEVEFGGDKIPFGNDLIFDLGEMKVSCEICEDLWVMKSPSIDHALGGANVIVNLSASNELIAKKDYRSDLVRMQSAKLYCCYAYCSGSFGESSQDLVFANHSLIASSGRMIVDSYDELGLSSAIIDVEKLNNDRNKYSSSFDTEIKKMRYIKLDSSFVSEVLPRQVKYPFVVSDDKKRLARSKEIINLQAKGLATRLYNSHIEKVVIGISGGLDSTLALLVCLEAFKILKKDRKDILALTLPGFATSSKTLDNALKLMELSGISYEEIAIGEEAKIHLKSLNHPDDVYDVTYENTQARLRTMILMNYANYHNGIVIGTGDLSELALGFCTYNGDHMSMYGVNCSIPKTLVKTLVKDYGDMNEELRDVLYSIVDTPISPELVPSKDGKIAQKTEDILGKYDLHDFFLYHFIRNSFSKEKIFELAKATFDDVDEGYIKKTLDLFFKRFFTQQFKRSCIPDGVKVGSVSLSPRGDLRLSSDISYCNSINEE